MTRCEDVEVDVPYDSALLSCWDLWKRVKRVMVNKGNHSLLWPKFRLVNYSNVLRYICRQTYAELT